MNSRYDNDYDREDGPPPEFWHKSLERAIAGERGQAILRDFKAILEAMPKRRLVKGAIVQCEEDGGGVCAVGAYAVAKLGRDAVIEYLSKRLSLGEDWEDWDQPTDSDTMDCGVAAGMQKTLAWELGRLNDDDYGHVDAEARWQGIYDWVCGHIK